MQHEWRLSKYDPALRDTKGNFLGEEWTSVSDVGHGPPGRMVSQAQYLAVEDSYVRTIVAFWRAHNKTILVVSELELGPEKGSNFAHVSEGTLIRTQDALEAIVRALLREEFWCKLRAPDGSCEIHFGYDYYVYLLSEGDCDLTNLAAREGLFLEPMASPYGCG